MQRSWVAFLLPLTIAAGPISKFGDRQPDLEMDTTSKMEDVERCLMDMDGLLAPLVYRQPDRPDVAMLIWKSPNGLSVGRIDIYRSAAGTHVRSWFPANQVKACVRQ